MREISLEEFVKTFKPIIVNEEEKGLKKYVKKIKDVHEIRRNETYSMFFWTEIDNVHLLNNKIYTGATGYVICEEEHDVDEKIKVIVIT